MFAFAAALLAAQSPVAPPPPGEAAIAYANRDGIVEYQADGQRGLYISALTGGWYYARTANRCSRLPAATTVGFVTVGSGDLDRFGSLLVEGQICPLESVTRSDPPPRRRHRR